MKEKNTKPNDKERTKPSYEDVVKQIETILSKKNPATKRQILNEVMERIDEPKEDTTFKPKATIKAKRRT